MLRREGEKGLDRETAQLFAGRALERLHREQAVANFSTLYFQLIRLLLYLLRIRRTDPACFDPNSPSDISAFHEAMESMAAAERYFSRRGFLHKAQQVLNIRDGFEKYLRYEGTEDVLIRLDDLTGSAA